MTSTVLTALREATGPHHARLDAGFDFPNELKTMQGRRRAAARFYGWQAGVERAMGDLLSEVPDLDLAERRRAHRFAPDLAVLGLDMASLPICAAPQAKNAAEAFGLLYVSEGSTLGGKLIGKRLTAAGHDLNGLGFLDPYGHQTGELWRGFLQVLDREARTDAFRRQSVEGAVSGFAAAETWFHQDEVVA